MEKVKPQKGVGRDSKMVEEGSEARVEASWLDKRVGVRSRPMRKQTMLKEVSTVDLLRVRLYILG